VGIPGSELHGPYPVGEYALALRGKLRSFTRVQLIGELVNLRVARARVYFELRDATGAIPCSAWRQDWEARCAKEGLAPEDGMQLVVAGGCDYYPGSASASPGFSFAVQDLRVAGEGDLLARIERLRRQLRSEGLLERQKLLPRPLLPRTIGVITGESGKARDDVLAALERRGWRGRLVWAFTPVQDRRAAPAICRALADLAAVEVEVAIVARGGGSLADLMALSDETLCRTVAMCAIPVIASVGHHSDRTVLDDVAAVSCSTPTHAAEAAVGIDCIRARHETLDVALRLRDHGRRAVVSRARTLTILSRAPAGRLERQRGLLHQRLRELRAGAKRRLGDERVLAHRRAVVLERKTSSALVDCRRRRPVELERLALALTGHDPQRTLERGYALVFSAGGDPVTKAAAAHATRQLRLRFADGELDAEVRER
jgi:exodeoxyribonuclease VII large subunit